LAVAHSSWCDPSIWKSAGFVTGETIHVDGGQSAGTEPPSREPLAPHSCADQEDKE